MHPERDRVLTEEEFACLCDKAPPTLKPIVICAWETGMRRGEIVSLTWPQANLKENYLTLESQDTKTGRKRLILISDLRRSFATRKVSEGWDRDYIKAITGHRTDKVFARYNKPSLEMLRAVVEGAPRATVVKLLATEPGQPTSTVLSA